MTPQVARLVEQLPPFLLSLVTDQCRPLFLHCSTIRLHFSINYTGIQHRLWVEQPEEFPTSLATKPYPKADISQYFKKLQLCKAGFS
jgi:hypothetical protein